MWGRLPFCFTGIHPCDVQMGWRGGRENLNVTRLCFCKEASARVSFNTHSKKKQPFWCYCASQKSERGVCVITPNQLSRCGSLQIMCSWENLLFGWIYLLQQKSKFLKYECLFENATTVMGHISNPTSSQFKPLFMLKHYIQSSASYINNQLWFKLYQRLKVIFRDQALKAL